MPRYWETQLNGLGRCWNLEKTLKVTQRNDIYESEDGILLFIFGIEEMLQTNFSLMTENSGHGL